MDVTQSADYVNNDSDIDTTAPLSDTQNEDLLLSARCCHDEDDDEENEVDDEQLPPAAPHHYVRMSHSDGLIDFALTTIISC